ncbi:MAG: M3 family oligoendopeptidase [Rhizobiaceae bacterium]|jgi:oligoendopeptidase F|nr:M3 family oligoendopeptidase [Rhizobiaceae bacterium]
MIELLSAATGPATAASTAEPLASLPIWDLSALYVSMDAPEIARDAAALDAKAAAFARRWKGRLNEAAQADGANGLGAAVAAYEEIEELAGRLGSYAGLLYYADTTNPAIVKFFADTQARLTAMSTQLVFFGLELNAVDDALLADGFTRDALLAGYRPWVEDRRKEKPYQLEERVEQVFSEKSLTGAGAWNRLFDDTMAALTFTVGDETLPLEATLNLLQDADPERRAAGGAALIKTFSDNTRLFTLITNTLAKDKEIADRWRGFADVADSRHLANRVEPEVVAAMVAAVRDAYPRISHRYYAMKAKWLGMEQLNFWDRNAPLPKAPQDVIGWDVAKETVLSAYAGFSPQMAAIAQRFFDENWIDAPARAGKAPGAFAHPTVPSANPYVLLNYLGRPRDVMTLAHELGHGVHQVLAGKQGTLMADTPLTLAETASVFGEMLTFKSLLARTSDPVKRKALLAQKAEDMINTVVRQIAFYSFERKVHLARRDGELTTEDINAMWLSVQGESLGPAVKLNDGYEVFWTYIPHFIHSPFYVYAYAFGDCLVNALYAVYENAAEGFQERYFAMLSAGGTKHHSELLAPFGLDAADPAFWARGLRVIEGIIDELEAMDA